MKWKEWWRAAAAVVVAVLIVPVEPQNGVGDPFKNMPLIPRPVCSPNEVVCRRSYCLDQTCDGTLVQSRKAGRCQCKLGLVRSERSRTCVSAAPNCIASPPPQPETPSTTTTAPTTTPLSDPPRTNPFTFGPAEPKRTQYLKKGGQRILYRMYHVSNTDHMLTRYISEVTSAIASHNYQFEGAIGRIAGSPTDILVPCKNVRALKRLWKGALEYDHFYTIIDRDAEVARGHGYVEEGVAGYCVRPQGCGANVRLYRFYDPEHQNHYYSTSLSETAQLEGQGEWVSEGVECYIWELF